MIKRVLFAMPSFQGQYMIRKKLHNWLHPELVRFTDERDRNKAYGEAANGKAWLFLTFLSLTVCIPILRFDSMAWTRRGGEMDHGLFCHIHHIVRLRFDQT